MDLDFTTKRKAYKLASLTENDILRDPLAQFSAWYAEAATTESHEANAMNLSTVDPRGVPASRMVLLKQFDDAGFVFFTNFESQKGLDIAANPNVALTFYWPSVERQVRVTGIAARVSPEMSDAYFASRQPGSQLSAIASPQSQPIPDRAWLEQRAHEVVDESTDAPLARPPHWGGYRVTPSRIEFWQGRPDRLHDRIVFVRTDNDWEMQRLAP